MYHHNQFNTQHFPFKLKKNFISLKEKKKLPGKQVINLRNCPPGRKRRNKAMAFKLAWRWNTRETSSYEGRGFRERVRKTNISEKAYFTSSQNLKETENRKKLSYAFLIQASKAGPVNHWYNTASLTCWELKSPYTLRCPRKAGIVSIQNFLSQGRTYNLFFPEG